MLSRPNPTEYAEFYKNYIACVPDGPVLDFLAKQLGDYRQLLVGVSDEAASAVPAPGKWSVKQVLGHICDAERVMAYRALRFARGDAAHCAVSSRTTMSARRIPIRAVWTTC